MNNPEFYNDKYFVEIISRFEGNHMAFHTSPIQIIEACFGDTRRRPIMLMNEKSANCVNITCDILTDLFKNIGKEEEFNQYPPLMHHILTVLLENMLVPVANKTKDRVLSIIKDEEAYIWTDDGNLKILCC